VPFAAQESQHSPSIIVIARLAENLVIDDDYRVSPNNQAIWKSSRKGFGLRARETLNISHRIFRSESCLIDVGGDCFKLPAYGGEYFLAARALRSHYELFFKHGCTKGEKE
jgi:hypothetical protein